MMERFVALFRPLFVPLLKLKLDAPHLPEGSALVRHLKPSEAWLTYRYLQAMFGLLTQIIFTAAGAVALIVELKGAGVALAALIGLVQLAVLGFALVTTRVDYELRHALIGDRSMRVSMGALTHQEVTLSYANIQNIEVMQGPFERLFGFKSLTVTTAGSDAPGTAASSLHSVTLVGLDDAEQVKAMMMNMLKHHKDSGLGEQAAPVAPSSAPALNRLLEIRDAAKALAAAAQVFESARR